MHHNLISCNCMKIFIIIDKNLTITIEIDKFWNVEYLKVFVRLTWIFPIVWNAVNMSMNVSPRWRTFRKLLSNFMFVKFCRRTRSKLSTNHIWLLLTCKHMFLYTDRDRAAAHRRWTVPCTATLRNFSPLLKSSEFT